MTEQLQKKIDFAIKLIQSASKMACYVVSDVAVTKATATTESGEAVRIDIDKLNRLKQERR